MHDYDALAPEYAARLADELAGKPLDRSLLDHLADEVRGHGTICDLGCGPGHVGRYLFDRGADVTGIDLSAGMLEQARRLHPGITFQQGDMLALDVEDGAFAGVASFYAIVHLAPASLPAAFREMRRVVRPGGPALVAFHIGDEVLRPGELWGIPVSLAWVFFRTEVVVDAMRSAGWTIAEVVERAPYEGVEHQSRRAYVLARA